MSADTALQAAKKTLAAKLEAKGVLPDHVGSIVDRAAENLSASSDGTVHVALRGKVLTRHLELDEALGYLAEAAALYAPGEWKRGGMSDKERQELQEQKSLLVDYTL